MARVLIVHGDRRPPGEGGGAESLLRDQARALKDRGHTVSWWWGQGSVEQAVAAFRPDACHLMTLHCYPMGLGPAAWLQRQGIPCVWHLQDYWPFCGGRMCLLDGDRSCPAVRGTCAPQGGRCQRAAPAYAAVVGGAYVVAGNAYSQDIYRRNGVRCDQAVELGVDTSLFAPGDGERDATAVYTSSAWPNLPHKGMHVLQAALKGTGVNARLLTGLPREQVAAALSRAAVFAFPSCYEETFGLSLCEAMACGCACVASDVAGARAQIADGETGLLVPPRDPLALREALLRLLGDACLRERLGQAARAHVAADHSLAAMGRRWETAYQGALEWRAA